jgi:hypothetical protein
VADDPARVDDEIVRSIAGAAVADPSSPVQGRDADELIAALSDRPRPERLLDLMLRTGPYGDGFGARPDGLSLDALLAAPHGIDLGPLEPRLPEVLRTPSGMVELAPDLLVADVARLRAALEERRSPERLTPPLSGGHPPSPGQQSERTTPPPTPPPNSPGWPPPPASPSPDRPAPAWLRRRRR